MVDIYPILVIAMLIYLAVKLRSRLVDEKKRLAFAQNQLAEIVAKPPCLPQKLQEVEIPQFIRLVREQRVVLVDGAKGILGISIASEPATVEAYDAFVDQLEQERSSL